MLDAALKMLDSGMSVIPVRNKRPLVDWTEFQTRRATADEVRGWAEQWPDAGVGIVTGAISNLVVLDVDGKVNDPVEFVFEHGLEPTVAVSTPRGGLHLYYAHPGHHVANAVRAREIGDYSLDVRGDGGFVVAPPSTGYTTLRYWKTQQPWPGVAHARQLSVTGNTSLSDINTSTAEDLFAIAPEGQRNHAAAKLAGYLLKTCSDEAAALVQLRQWNRNNLPPLDERELERTFQSIAKREALKPRSLVMNERESRTANPDEPDWLEGDAWADQAANTPERNGQRLHSLPLCEEHKGFEPGDIVTIAGRQGVGKTSLLTNLFWEIGKGLAESAFFFSGDMSPAQILQWMTIGRMQQQRYAPADWQDSLQMLRDSRMAIKYSVFIATERIEDVLKKRPGTRYVAIDHFNKMRTGSETRATDLKRVASDLKDMGGYYGCTFLVLSQLNRLADNVEYLLPSHLSESDALVSESDVIYGLSCVGDRTKQDPDRATVRVALLKNRFGREFVEQIAWFHKATKRFEWLNRDINWRDVA